MQPFIVPWSFFMMFDYDKNQLVVYPSEEYKRKLEFQDDKYIIEGDDIKELIHKYDYRKLIYFSQNPLVQPFDTVLRMRLSVETSYLRTQAICHSHVKGFNCLLVEDKYLHKLKPLWQLESSDAKHISLLDQSIYQIDQVGEIDLFKLHLSKVLSKTNELINT